MKRFGFAVLKVASVLLVLFGMVWLSSICLEHPDNTLWLLANSGWRLLAAFTLIAVGLGSHCWIAMTED